MESVDTTFGDSDNNIDDGLDVDFVVDRVLATSYAGHKEIWIAPKKELLLLYLNQYIPETAHKLMMKSLSKQYAVEKGNQTKNGEL
mmetsp:Transcript_5831/g.10455  ORF Transcript_5831/g.10455 Transcript_5831/m.10455 type:complete len:86 (-) Transcript_5831:52-309(-)